ncbi:SRR1-like protein isoform X2 [Cimex lectularius]|uniref:SRR1-like domain-containing protein n=1 Tax=Cimex lectularius TaxID=79782 RepID=A0A8I6RR19_CIMLE|nr:SRR1-like protein isoform X2 [Cimex lectularius]
MDVISKLRESSTQNILTSRRSQWCEMEEDGFKLVKKKKKKNYEQFDEESPLYLERVKKKFLEVKGMMVDSLQFFSFVKSIDEGLVNLDSPKVEEIVCYGLGNFSKSPNARYQYAMAVELSEFYACPLLVFDPVFTEPEKKILEEMRSELIPRNEMGKRKATKSTLFFLPHCPRELFNNILLANWGESLANCIIAGNNLASIVESTPSRSLKNEFPYLVNSFEHAEIIEVKNTFQFLDVFNDMAVHVFPNKKILNSVC